MKRAVVLMLALLAAMSIWGCAADDDDDNNNTPADDDAIDDDADDDVDDDIDDDVDDDIDDDVDDDVDDDSVDDDTVLPPEYGWIILDPDRDHVSWVLNQAASFGIDHVQLSHDIIMEIDEINNDETRAQLVQDFAREAHDLGLGVWVWSHEFTDESPVICWDPEDNVWARRQEEYRQALTRVPEIDGVVLMFGSADTEPWYTVCLCDWCREEQPNFLLSLAWPPPAERARRIWDAVGEVVLDEFGKKLRFRTFMHQPLELQWLGNALREGSDPRLMVMTKDVPQDWQPYYPHDPLIGNIGAHHQIIEMDLGNEYWGVSQILNGQVDYLYYRYTYDRAQGARGAAARIERGTDHAFGNPNEINIYAFTRITQDETATPDEVYREWFEQRYGIDPDSPAADTLKQIFRQSHYAMRKMYYTLGQWTQEKGSEITTNARYPGELWARCSAFYDPAWLLPFFSLVLPDEQTLIDLWQEKLEAEELAADNVAELENMESAFANPDDYAELYTMLTFHADIAEAWRCATDATYRFVYYQLGHSDQAAYIEWDARRLLELADEIEATWGADAPLATPVLVRAFVDDLREGFPAQPNAEPWEQPQIYDVAAEDLGSGEYRVTWETSEPMSSFVEWADDLPLYEAQSNEDPTLTTTHEVDINIGEEGRHVYRVGGHAADDTLVRSGDYWVGLDP